MKAMMKAFDRIFGGAFMLLILMTALMTALMMSCEPVFAQSVNTTKSVVKPVNDVNNLKIVSFTGYIHGTDSVLTDVFTRGNADSVYSVWMKFGTATDTAKVSVKLLGGIGTFYNVLETYYADSAKTLTHVRRYYSYNADYFKLLLHGNTGNGYKVPYTVYMVMRKP